MISKFPVAKNHLWIKFNFFDELDLMTMQGEFNFIHTEWFIHAQEINTRFSLCNAMSEIVKKIS